MAAAQAGDVDAYKTLLSELAVWLRRYFVRRLPPAMIEDAVQDILLAIHAKRHTYDPKRSLAPWLAAIARYKWIDRLRSPKSEAGKPLGENLGIPDQGGSALAGTARQQLAELQPPQAEVVRPAKVESHSVEEAFRGTGRLPALVKVNFHRGIRRLADIIKATGDAF
jgi:DNA-directed RNA polymerase specialized sigma24 family protein